MFLMFFYSHNVEAKAGNYFGGRVSLKQPCTCSPGTYLVTITGGSSSGTYLDTPAARKYAQYFITSGRNTLGEYTPGGICLMSGDPCSAINAKGTIKYLGLSF